jgi:hypothetical protein
MIRTFTIALLTVRVIYCVVSHIYIVTTGTPQQINNALISARVFYGVEL